jgi:hypothetical protein
MSISCTEFVRFLEVEYMHSAGHDNGRLKATYRQLEQWGIHTDRIKRAIDEAVERGLVEITVPGGYRGYARNYPSQYRLTYYPTKQMTPSGAWEWIAPTDDWRQYKSAGRREPLANYKSASQRQQNSA